MNPGRLWKTLCGVCVSLFCLIPGEMPLHSQPPASTGNTAELTLKEFLNRVLERNETLQTQMLEVEINRRRYLAERGIFEPELFGSFERNRTLRENTAEQSGALFSQPLFSEKNNTYAGGLESLVPTGGRIRLGYTLRDLLNNVQTLRGFPNGEYQTFLGANITQPLLKNNGLAATMINIRLAAAASEIAFHEYRRQYMLLVSTAEASYWNLYMAQEQLRFFDDSVALADSILRDNRTRFQAGKGSELEILEAESGLALRKTKQSEARQKLNEAATRLITLYSEPVYATNVFVKAVDRPQATEVPLSYFESRKSLLDRNPDYLIEQRKVLQEGIKLAYAQNQRLPQLDLKASYGLNGLGGTPAESWQDVERRQFPAWSVGVEMRVPLGGGLKSKHELDGARLRQQQALLRLKEVETQVGNALDTSIHKVQSTRESVQSYQTVINFNQNLLETQLARLEVGRVESRKVLEVERDLLETKSALVEALVNYQRSLLEFELVQGLTLKNRNLEPTPKELEVKTILLAGRGKVSESEFQQLSREVQAAYQKSHPVPGSVFPAKRWSWAESGEYDPAKKVEEPNPVKP